MANFDREQLEKHAYGIRKNIIYTIVTNGEGHAGGALSASDIMSALYFGVMNFDSADKKKSDKFLLSAGHKCLALYGTLVEKGWIDEKELKTYNNLGTIFPGHPDSTKISQIDFSTGSLGHGLPLGCGYAIAAKKQGLDYKTYVVMGDGEQGEGSNWEAASIAAKHGLDNLIAILDENSLQINGRTSDVSKATPFEDRYAAFGWDVQSVDGHDVVAIAEALVKAGDTKGKPSIIIAKTVKGKGLSILEDQMSCHHWHPNAQAAKEAVAEFEAYGKNRGWV